MTSSSVDVILRFDVAGRYRLYDSRWSRKAIVMFQQLRRGVYLQLRTVFSDAVRRRRLDNAIQYTDPDAKAAVPISWDPDHIAGLVAPLRRKLRAVDFVVEVRDARIPVSTLHPQLRAWAGKKPRVMVLNKADLISHRDKVEWERHFEQKNIQVRLDTR